MLKHWHARFICKVPYLQGSGDPFEMFNNLFGAGMGGMGGAGRGGQQKMRFNMGGSGGGGMGGGGIEDILMGGMFTSACLQSAQSTSITACSAVGSRSEQRQKVHLSEACQATLLCLRYFCCCFSGRLAMVTPLCHSMVSVGVLLGSLLDYYASACFQTQHSSHTQPVVSRQLNR